MGLFRRTYSRPTTLPPPDVKGLARIRHVFSRYNEAMQDPSAKPATWASWETFVPPDDVLLAIIELADRVERLERDNTT